MTRTARRIGVQAPALLLVGSAAGLQSLVLFICWPLLTAFDARAREIAASIAQDARPPVSSLVPPATSMLTSASIVMLASAASWLLIALIARRWLTKSLTRPRGWRFVLVPLLAAELVTAAAMACAEPVVGRGQYAAVVVALPNAAVLSATMLAIATAFAIVHVQPAFTAREGPADVAPNDVRSEAADNRALRAAAWALALAAVLIAGFLFAPAEANRPIADDYRYFANIRASDFVSFLITHLQTETGRYTQGAMMWLSFRLFGTSAVQIIPWMLVIGLSGAVLAVIRVFGPKIIRAWGIAVPLASSVAVLAVISLPSVPDSLLWLSSSTVYLTGAIGWILAIACLGIAWRALGVRRAWWAVLACLAAFLAQGCYEAVSAIGVVVALIAVVATRSRSARVLPAVAVLGVSIAGLAIIGLAPSVAIRASTNAAGSLSIGAFGALFTDLQLWHDIGAATWLLATGVGLVLAMGLKTSPSRSILAAGATGAALLTLVPVICGAISFLGLGWAPIRTYTVPAIAFSAGLALMIAAATASILRSLQRSSVAWVRLVPTVAAIVGSSSVQGTRSPPSSV